MPKRTDIKSNRTIGAGPTITLPSTSPREGEVGTRSVPGGGASSKKSCSSLRRLPPSQPSPSTGEGFCAPSLSSAEII